MNAKSTKEGKKLVKPPEGYRKKVQLPTLIK